jgi:photosystem II stability/assembly factor-like uncharacterized protein
MSFPIQQSTHGVATAFSKVSKAVLLSLGMVCLPTLLVSSLTFSSTVLSAAPAAVTVVLPESGPLTKQAVSRLLISDAARFGNRVVAVADRGYIIYSDDNGETWTRAKSPAGPLLTAVFFIDAKVGWAVGHDLMVLQTTDGGENWSKQNSKPDENKPFLDVHFNDINNGFAIGAYGAFYETADSGKTWTARKLGESDKHLNSIFKVAENKLLIVGEAGILMLSEDAGKNWTTIEPPYKGSYFGGIVADDGAVIIYGLRGRIFRSADQGKTWAAVENKMPNSLMGGTKLPNGKIALVGLSGVLLMSSDNGKSFESVKSGSTKAYSAAILGAPSALLLFGEAGARDIVLAAGGAPATPPLSVTPAATGAAPAAKAK